jgi:alanyl-tRNA synthetase
LLENVISETSGKSMSAKAFRLYDTFGFPKLLCFDFERGLALDEAGFDVAMQEQKRSAASDFN